MNKQKTDNQKDNGVQQVKGGNLLELALLAFAGLGLDVLYLMLELAIYGKPIGEWSEWMFIVHWILISITWGIICRVLICHARKKYKVTVISEDKKIRLWQWCIVLLCVLVNLVWSLYSWEGFKIVIELQNNGVLKFVFQYIYYVFETGLFVLIVIFGQQAFELWFHKREKVNIPYGGILLAVTWGMVHMLTKGSLTVGLQAAGSSILYGIVYLLLNRNYKWSFLILFLMFIL